MRFQEFADRSSASQAAAQRLGGAVGQQLQATETALLAVSGGTTPLECFEQLSKAPLPWQNVQVTLTDERCVPADHADSNERMVRERLLQGNAAPAQFVALDAIPQLPFAAVLLGMGTDGHFASLFPDAENLAAGLDLQSPEATVSIQTAASPHGRTSLTLPRLLNTQCLTLLIFGTAKRRIIEAACRVTSLQLPISHVLNQNNVPVHIFWAE